MKNIVTIAVPSLLAGQRVMDKVQAAVDAGRIHVDDLALVYRTEEGKVKLQQTTDMTAGHGFWRGALWGVVAAIVAPVAAPAAVVAAGGGLGAWIAGAGDKGISNKFMKQAGETINDHESVVFVLADEASAREIASEIQDAIAEGAKVEYEVLNESAEQFLREALTSGEAKA
ncbi:MAG TPA: DUF1269 domain-containing protein [Arachnia sp.]|nr:DUF1269 domain-containing protein [Arachnia sp.]HMT86265.1 DUF1269 domain-containing protein [Arachnia sp.]